MNMLWTNHPLILTILLFLPKSSISFQHTTITNYNTRKSTPSSSRSSIYARNKNKPDPLSPVKPIAINNRRDFAKIAIITPLLLSLPKEASATRAVGGAEIECRERGDCLENFELDGAVGWNWGAKDRCESSDPLCGPDGQIREGGLEIESVPSPMGLEISHVALLKLSVGKGGSSEFLEMRIGLYGKDCPLGVGQLVEFMGEGLATTSRLAFEDGMGVQSAPVALSQKGTMTALYPSEKMDFGVDSQKTAYAMTRGRPRLGENFTPQPRPSGDAQAELQAEISPRKLDAAGLLSVAKGGLGYGGSGMESEDEAFYSSFQITAAPSKSADRESRRVLGQLMDGPSMAALARLATLPVKKGIKGVIPGQNYGPPFLRVSVVDVTVTEVGQV